MGSASFLEVARLPADSRDAVLKNTFCRAESVLIATQEFCFLDDAPPVGLGLHGLWRENGQSFPAES
jgi:hypothetical protein